jgi:hypothetical protein
LSINSPKPLGSLDALSGEGGDNVPTPHGPLYAFGRNPIDYAKNRMTDAVKQNRMVDPYLTPKFGVIQSSRINFTRTSTPQSSTRRGPISLIMHNLLIGSI